MNMRSVMRCVWPLLFGAACAGEGDDPEQDLGDLEGIEEVGEGLTEIEGCAFASNTMTLTLDSGDVALVNKRSDGKIVVNGYECQGATSTLLKKLSVVQGTTGNQTLILDYLGGTFAPGLTGANNEGVNVNLGDGTGDALKIRGTKLVDNYIFGADAIQTNSDTFKDIIHTNVENFVVTMSDGNDVFSGAGGGTATTGTAFTAAVTVYGGAGNDSIRGGAGDDTYFGGDGDDTFLSGADDDGSDVMSGGGGTADTASYVDREDPLTITLDGTDNDGEGGATEGDDVQADVEIVRGGKDNDTITGSAAKNTIYGGDGNDTLAGGDEDDILNGDAGDDIFDEGTATNGKDTFNGGAGTDTVSYADRTNAVTVTVDATANDGEGGTTEGDKVPTDVENVTGGDGGDTITGSTSVNELDGGGGGDTVNGGDGNDTLVGGDGNDTLNGGNGDDTFDESSGDGSATGNDTMFGNAGIDTVSYADRANALTVVMNHNTTTPGTSSGDTGNSEADKVGDDIENLIGGDEADTLTGNALDNQIEGGDAVDTISTGAGDDLVDGGAGDDIIDCGAGDADLLLDSTVAADPDDPVGCEL
jgi:Ca2+-binding RTX toxin-like protein